MLNESPCFGWTVHLQMLNSGSPKYRRIGRPRFDSKERLLAEEGRSLAITHSQGDLSFSI